MTKKVLHSPTDIQPVALYLNRIGARVRSFKCAVVEKGEGKYHEEVAVIRFDEAGNVTAPADFAPTDGERETIKAAFAEYEFPKHVCVDALVDIPAELTPGSFEIFHNKSGQIEMLQQRIVDAKGEKQYIPWTYWNDSKWRKVEHGELLPLWGIAQLKDNSIVFLHEGAKAARAVVEKLKRPGDFPWSDEMADTAHIGWIGGAKQAHRTRWELLRGVTRVYIVADNDDEGRSAVWDIAKHIHCPTFLVRFDGDFPVGFDLADSFPEKMFKTDSHGTRRYIGKTMRERLEPATWADDAHTLPAEGKGRPKTLHTLREGFKSQWQYVSAPERIVNVEFPHLRYTDQQFNAKLARFSHTNDPAKLLKKQNDQRADKLTYRPDIPDEQRFISEDGVNAFNQYRPPLIKPIKDLTKAQCLSAVKPFLDFMEYFIPDPVDRYQTLRWSATLIARPDIRMPVSLVVRSTAQGVGKTLFGDVILSRLLGHHNCSWPTELMLVKSQFTGFMENKRLLVCNEIHMGNSWAAYNTLKGFVTDDYVEINAKHEKTYTIRNMTHLYATTNAIVPIRLEDGERRMFLVQATECPWPLAKFTEFRKWLDEGGLALIATWASQFKDYWQPGERAPMTQLKRDVIEDSLSRPERLVKTFGEWLAKRDVGTCVSPSLIDSALVAFFDHDPRHKVSKKKIAELLTHVRIDENDQGEVLATPKQLFVGQYVDRNDRPFINGKRHSIISNSEELIAPNAQLVMMSDTEILAKLRDFEKI